MSKRMLVIVVAVLVLIIAIPMVLTLVAPRLARHIIGAKPPIAAGECAMLTQQVELWMFDNGRTRLPDDFALGMLTRGADPYLHNEDLIDPWLHPYVVWARADSDGFTIISCGPDGVLGGGDDIREDAR